MTEDNSKAVADPSLKTYFQYKVSNCNISVQFSNRKIIDIIKRDLRIYIGSPKCLFARVCVEAFSYYLQNWPEWDDAMKTKYTVILYKSLISYLRVKMLKLKEKAKSFQQKNTTTVPNFDINNTETISPKPVDVQSVPEEEVLKKESAPCCLKVNIPEDLWNNTDIKLEDYDDNLIYLRLMKNPSSMRRDFKIEELLNYPFVHVEFTLPGLITFSRSTPFKIERFLQSQYDPVSTDLNHIISVVESDITSPHKVYTFALMTALFNTLKRILTKYSYAFFGNQEQQITALCDAFLSDIFESNLKKRSVCEGTTVSYNIAKMKYYVNTELRTENRLDEELVFKKVLTPIISYNLISCGVTHVNEPITGDIISFDYFTSVEKDMDSKTTFLCNVKNSLKYKCTLCDLNLSFAELKTHVLETHHYDRKFACAICFKKTFFWQLIPRKWSHECDNV